MSQRKARARFYRQQWAPAALGVAPGTLDRVPLEYLHTVCPGVYHLGPRGMLIDRQVAVLEEWVLGERVQQDMNFFREFFKLHGLGQQAARDARVPERVKSWVLYYQRRPEAEMPDPEGFLNQRETKTGSSSTDLFRNDGLGALASARMFVALSANMDRLAKSPEAIEFVHLYEQSCQRWQLPTT